MELPRGPFLWSIAILLAICLPLQTLILFRRLREALETDGSRHGFARWRHLAVFLVIAAIFVAAIAIIIVRVDGNFGGSLIILALFVFLGMWSLSLLYVPLGAAMLIARLIGTSIVLGPLPAFSAFGSEIANFLARIDLAVLPLFVLMGGLAEAGGLSDDIYRFAQAMLGRRRGGLALATIGGCEGFGAVTGSSIATVATIGRAALPEMLRRGYAPELDTGNIAAAGTLGILIPPSSAMILYALLTEVSIGKLFVAAIIPGVIAVLIYMATVSTVVRLRPSWAPGAQRSTLAEILRALRSGVLVILLFGIVLGGIYGGIFTATEAAAVGAGIAFLIALLRGRLRGRLIFKVLAETAATTAMLYLLILGGITFASFMAITEVPATLVGYLQSFDMPRGAVILMLLVIYVLLGAVMDPYAIMLITVPITAPLVAGLGYDLVWWGIVMVVVIETGLITPPRRDECLCRQVARRQHAPTDDLPWRHSSHLGECGAAPDPIGLLLAHPLAAVGYVIGRRELENETMPTSLPPVRGIVTANRSDRRSHIVEDREAPAVLTVAERPGYRVTNLWVTSATPTPIDAPDASEQHAGILPAENGTVVRFIDIPPEPADPAERDRNYARMFERIYKDAGQELKPGVHPEMHKTATIDYAIVISGEIYALMDDGETLMKTGDILIQRGTNHAWSNRSGKMCRMAFVLIDGE